MLTKTTAKGPRMRHAVVPGLLLLLIVALHALPGEDIAHASWLDALHVDKLVHLGLFLMFAHSVFVGLGQVGDAAHGTGLGDGRMRFVGHRLGGHARSVVPGSLSRRVGCEIGRAHV